MIFIKLKQSLDFSNIDLYLREVKEEYIEYKLIFFSSLIDEYMVMELQKSIRYSKSNNEVISKLNNIKLSTTTSISEAILFLHEGQVILYLENEEKLILVDLRKTPLRSIQEPDSEKTIRGSKDGFNESLINNLSLLRCRIKSNNFQIDAYRIGQQTKTSICVCYLKNKVNKNKLKYLEDKIKNLDVDSLLMSDRALEEKLFEQKKTIFPLVRYTERPDVSSLYIIRGHIVILVDTSSSSIIIPISIFDHMKNVEEYRQNFIVGNFIKIIRYIGAFLSLFFLPLAYLLATSSDIINLVDFRIENMSIIPIYIQLLIGIFVIELFRGAIIFTPNSLTSTLSLVIGIILGEISMKLGIFNEDVLLILAIFYISSFSTPSYELSLSNRVLSIIYFIVSIIFNKIGFLIALTLTFIHLLNIKILGYPYLYPLIPLDIKELSNKFFRRDSKNNKKV